MLNYEFIKHHYRLIVIDLSQQKELDVHSKAIQQIKFTGQLKNLDNNGNAVDPGSSQSRFVLKILEKIKEIQL